MKTWRHCAVLLPLLCLSSQAEAGDTLRPPGVGRYDRRTPVDQTQEPWSSLVRVQTNRAAMCTGVAVSFDQVLTAAHCVVNPYTQAPFQPLSLHVLTGYQRGRYAAHRKVRSFMISPGYRPAQPLRRLGADWAILTLSEPLPVSIRPLALAAGPLPDGAQLVFGGYSQDRAQIIMADMNCRVIDTEMDEGGELIVHDCMGSRGTSGAPLLVKEEAGWKIIGIEVAVNTTSELRNLAVPAKSIDAMSLNVNAVR